MNASAETMSAHEQRAQLAAEAFSLAAHWGSGISDRLTAQERVHGAVHAVLDLLENGNDNVPAFQLTPVLDEDRDRMHLKHEVNGEPIDTDWDYGMPMGLTGPDGEPSATDVYKGMYDTYRERFTVAARELFDVAYFK